jgi:predicted RNA-binding Zn-ribbon protein involved in translation (DUF1610 family)
MTLLDWLRAAQAARVATDEAGASGDDGDVAHGLNGELLAGRAVLGPEHREAMRRVLTRELSTFPVEWAAAMARREVTELLERPAGEGDDEAAEVIELRAATITDPCPNCRGEATVIRVDLTLSAGWFECRGCGLRFGRSLSARERSNPLPR